MVLHTVSSSHTDHQNLDSFFNAQDISKCKNYISVIMQSQPFNWQKLFLLSVCNATDNAISYVTLETSENICLGAS